MSINLDRNRAIQRACLSYLYSLGMPEDEKRPDVWVLGEELTRDVPRKRRAWVAESVLYAFREMSRCERCDWAVVLRCFKQATAYAAELEASGNGLVHPNVRDAVTELQHELESRVRR